MSVLGHKALYSLVNQAPGCIHIQLTQKSVCRGKIGARQWRSMGWERTIMLVKIFKRFSKSNGGIRQKNNATRDENSKIEPTPCPPQLRPNQTGTNPPFFTLCKGLCVVMKMRPLEKQPLGLHCGGFQSGQTSNGCRDVIRGRQHRPHHRLRHPFPPHPRLRLTDTTHR